MSSLDHLRPWMVWAGEGPEDLEVVIQRLRRWRGNFDLGKDFVYAIFSRDETQVLGSTGLHTRAGEDAREIGYWIHVDHVNQGLATETAAALTKVAFEVDGVKRVEIHCASDNMRSAAVPRKLGFVHEATLRQRSATVDGQQKDTLVWTLLADEYATSAAAEAEVEVFDVVRRRIL